MLVGFGIVVVVAAAIWLIGGLVARVLGIAFSALGAFGLLLGFSGGLLILAFGVVLWIAGQWLFAFKYHGWRSPLARRLFTRTPLRALDPTRRWGVRLARPGGHGGSAPSNGEPLNGWKVRASDGRTSWHST